MAKDASQPGCWHGYRTHSDGSGELRCLRHTHMAATGELTTYNNECSVRSIMRYSNA